MLTIISTLMVLSFFFNSGFLQTGILQTGRNQFVENQRQNQDNTGRFVIKNLPTRLEFFCRTVLAETSFSRYILILQMTQSYVLLPQVSVKTAVKDRMRRRLLVVADTE